MYWVEQGVDIDKIEYTTYYYKNQKRADVVNDDIMCFDIETSSAFYDVRRRTLEPFNKNKSQEYYQSCIKYALCYVWQFSINENVYMGRTLEDFVIFLKKLSEVCIFPKIVYVHNLSYEFQFLRNVMKFSEVFARDMRKVLYFKYDDYMFRCSYFLTNMSLDMWSKQKKLKVQKLTGTYDYNKMRTPKTFLNNIEKAYCINDVLSMYQGLLQYKEQYKHIIDIPLTQTGEVRREVQKRMAVDSEYKYRKKCVALIPKTVEDYRELINVFQGGYTHASSVYANSLLENVLSYDIASSYPTVMCLKKYPMTEFYKVTPSDRFFNNDEFSYIIKFECKNIKSNYFNTFLSSSKCLKLENKKVDNGRVLSADYLLCQMTNIDFELFKRCYNYTDLVILDFKVSINRYLSDTFVKYILELYSNKTKLKNMADFEPLYMKSKQMLNSLYGMMVTKDITDDIIFDSDWKKEFLTEDSFNEKVKHKKRQISKTFTAFQFGVWVTAYARKNLWNAIIANDENVVYCDTDSVKLVEDSNFFIEYNRKIEELENIRADMLGVPRESFAPLDKKGKPHRMGIFDFEGKYDRFKTLGAKKYITENDGKLSMTVAGVPKKAVCQIDTIEQFKDGLLFDVEHANKLLMSYQDDMQTITWNEGLYDEYRSNYKYGIVAQPTTYTLGMTVDYIILLLLNGRKETRLLNQ